MTIDIDIYKVNKDFIVRYALGKGKDDLCGSVGMLAQSLMVPAVVVAYWIAEAHGYPDNVMTTIDNLVRFYRYTEIKNKPAGSPR